jgi:hypothetical protein
MSTIKLATGCGQVRGWYIDPETTKIVKVLNNDLSEDCWKRIKGQRPFFYGIAAGKGMRFGGMAYSFSEKDSDYLGSPKLIDYNILTLKGVSVTVYKTVAVPNGVRFLARHLGRIDKSDSRNCVIEVTFNPKM